MNKRWFNIETAMFFLLILWYIILVTINLLPKQFRQELISEEKFFRLDYLVHFISFFLLGFLYVLIKFFKSEKKLILRDLLFVIIGTASGICIEFAQKMVPNRSFNPKDMSLNLIGFVIGFILTWWIAKRMLSRKTQL
jgi:VanZ family protein